MEPTIPRWSAKRKVELLLQLIRGEKKLVDVCREQDLKQSEVEAWMDTFVKAGERGLNANAEDEVATHPGVEERRAKVGELVLEMGGSQRPGTADVAERDGPGKQAGPDRAALPVVRRAAVEFLLHHPRFGRAGRGPHDAGARHHRGQSDLWGCTGSRCFAPAGEPADQPQGAPPHHPPLRLAGVAEAAGEAAAGGDVAVARAETERTVASDTTHLFTSRDRWCHLTAIIDCCGRTIVGWRLSRSGNAQVAASALEDALRDRRNDARTNLSLRSDNGPALRAKAFVRVAGCYGVSAMSTSRRIPPSTTG
jgi:hypothetical protein